METFDFLISNLQQLFFSFASLNCKLLSSYACILHVHYRPCRIFRLHKWVSLFAYTGTHKWVKCPSDRCCSFQSLHLIIASCIIVFLRLKKHFIWPCLVNSLALTHSSPGKLECIDVRGGRERSSARAEVSASTAERRAHHYMPRPGRAVGIIYW